MAFSLDAAALNAVTLLMSIAVHIGDYTALSVFFWFQIPDFDLRFDLFSLCHFLFLATCLGCWFVLYH